MDIEKLKRCLKCCADDNSKACNKCELEYGEEECQNLCGYAATALSTLQAENERLKNKLSELAHFPFDEPGIGERTRLMAENAELRAELEQKEKYYEQMVDALAATESAKLEQVKRENETLKHALQNWHEEV